jgi:hypothetical protein
MKIHENTLTAVELVREALASGQEMVTLPFAIYEVDLQTIAEATEGQPMGVAFSPPGGGRTPSIAEMAFFAHQYLARTDELLQEHQDHKCLIHSRAAITKRLTQPLVAEYLRPNADPYEIINAALKALAFTCVAIPEDELNAFAGSLQTEFMKAWVDLRRLAEIAHQTPATAHH